MSADQFRPFQHDILFLERLLSPPDAGFESRPRRCHRRIDIHHPTTGQHRAGLAIHRPVTAKGLSRNRGAIVAVDEMTAFELEGGKRAFPIVAGIGLGHREVSSKRLRQRHDPGSKGIDIRIGYLADRRTAHRLVFRRPHLRGQIFRGEPIECLGQNPF